MRGVLWMGWIGLAWWGGSGCAWKGGMGSVHRKDRAVVLNRCDDEGISMISVGWRKKKKPEIEVVLGKPEAIGDLHRESIRRVVENHRLHLRYCYERERVRSRRVQQGNKPVWREPLKKEGDLAVMFHIGSQGTVLSAEIKQTTLRSRPIEACIKQRVRAMRFPASKCCSYTLVRYPISFKRPKSLVKGSSLSVGKVLVRGTMSKKILERSIRSSQKVIRRCYERELSKYPKMRGELRVIFQVEENGMVSAARVEETTLQNDRVESCVEKRIKGIQFPSLKGRGVVQGGYQFTFEP